jgi:hypothetical protein
VKLGNKQLVEKLTRSATYRDYVRAFSTATGVPLALRAVEHWQPALRGASNENPFCELMARSTRVCAACLEVQRKLTEKTGDRSRTVTCFAGLSDSAVKSTSQGGEIGRRARLRIAKSSISKRLFSFQKKRILREEKLLFRVNQRFHE